ncbi:saccharopine dehydrogenase C-terminal domain-containing protein [Marinovum sp. 2_MG-2023]|uniref:saccharopine dehydrogenase C-terminal domain-containing protein n=1 Tax=unclassified Marinovum TaxID=2647166 RepID=UPI0026E43436|nr:MULTISPECIES: saccharopine dehydrogenase C-terminal domain-containing protein [unclassified Marinovum]MDO6729227.1 saccharopine dehydrogenase C-terminal domain-containing protein [Marinovum sp. 2_MG-2023]MDO6779146.1 saccharopine dehydrogenase C-terminal domain-containing protein [Marinovum sp. 1_MG-2023]
MKTIAILGLGKVGTLAGELLHASGFTVTGIDSRAVPGLPFECQSLDVADLDALRAALTGQDAVLSCLPYFLNTGVAQIAHDLGLNYFDLTEDVPTTKAILALSKTSKGLMAPQCGLAPGFVGIVGADLISQFDSCRSCRMRVGALPQNPTGQMGYSFNWSPEGVVNEYLNDCEVLENGEIKWVSPMEWIEKVMIGGIELEAFTTSGGLGTMCETYANSVPNMDYKTMRYPGHVDLMNFFFHELLMRDRREEAGEILVNAKPPVSDDIVYIHVSAEGEIDGRLERREFVRGLKPVDIAGKHRTAIAWTTASSVVAVIEMVRDGVLPQEGFLKQEDIPLAAFLKTANGARYA